MPACHSGKQASESKQASRPRQLSGDRSAGEGRAAEVQGFPKEFGESDEMIAE
jgi:hypothetical protein